MEIQVFTYYGNCFATLEKRARTPWSMTSSPPIPRMCSSRNTLFHSVLKHVHNHHTTVTSRLSTSYLLSYKVQKYIKCNLSFSCLPRLILFKSAKSKKAQEIFSDTTWIYCAWKMLNKMAILIDKCKFECIIPHEK